MISHPPMTAPSSPKKTAKAAAVKRAKEKVLGKVTHYYDRIGVAIVKLASPLKVGDAIRLRKGEVEVEEVVSSLQINHANVEKAKKGEEVGMKVGFPAKEGTVVLAAS